jgi:dihydrofolate reductase
MRKIILPMQVSVDGFFEGPARQIDWHLIDDELHTFVNESLRTMGAFLSGRVSWELMASVWPAIDRDPAASKPMAEFAKIWLSMPKIVFSRTLAAAGWNTTIARDVDPDAIAELKAQPGGDMVVGGADLAATFLRHGLVDEHWLYVQPIVLGEGRRLFPADAKMPLRLVESRRFGNGVVLLRYVAR